MMHETIAIIADFDDTLAPDSTSSFLDSLGVGVPEFWNRHVQVLLDDDWDPVPAYLYTMIHASASGLIPPITRDNLAGWGPKIDFYEGVTTIFDRLREHAASINPRISLEFYIISSGIGQIVRNTAIAGQFCDIWACEFHCDADGRIVFPKRVVSFTDKTRYLFHVAKGFFGPESRSKPFAVNKKFDDRQLRIPFDQMIFVGDGYTDVPCFSLVRKQGGVAIGVYDNDNKAKWGRAWGFIEDERVSNLVPADYSERSALSNSLLMAVESIARRITPRASDTT